MTTKHDPGIDYSGGLCNKPDDQGVRTGIIHMNELGDCFMDHIISEYPCNECERFDKELDHCEDDYCETEPISQRIDAVDFDGYVDSSGDVVLMKSPFFTYAQFCSPCAPGCCYLTNPVDEFHTSNKAYCFDNEWFDNERPCPYPVWSVETGKKIYTPKEQD